jgi:predicted phage terminase large subunit-like protein
MTKTPVNIRALEDELIARVAAQQSFEKWIDYRQDGGLKPALHHKLIISELEKVERGETRRLMLIFPPGSAKSTYSSMEFPAWYLGRNPGKLIIGASNVADLAARFGRKARNIVGSKEFKAVFEDTLSADAAASDDWETVKGSEYKAVGVGGTIAGRRADCVLGNTMIICQNGVRRIDTVKVGDYVLSESVSGPLYRRVVAVAARRTTEYWRIGTASGNVVEATGNHRIYVNGDWKQTQAIAHGDVLMRLLREKERAASSRTVEESQEEQKLFASLFPQLRNETEQQKSGDASFCDMQNLWQAYAKQTENMLAIMLACHSRKTRAETAHDQLEKLQHLRDFVQARNECLRLQNLFHAMQERIAFSGNEGTEQSRLDRRSYTKETERQGSAGVQDSQKERHETGSGLRSMSVNGETGSASHQPEPYRQQLEERGHALPEMPCAAAFCAEEQAVPDVVSMVKRVRCPEGIDVYDIEVEETHNFYANGILVHNCGLIDDPVKSKESAESERERNKTWDWYVNDFETRLKPNASQIFISTRWHEADLGGQILNRDGDMWRVIRVPMEADSTDDPLGRKIGERLWPEWFTEEMVTQAKKDVRTWNALYQGNPVPEDGNYFQKDWFVEYEPGDLPSTLYIYGASDYAVTEGKGDYTEHGVFGVDWDGDLWVLDWWYGQTEPDKWIEAQCDLILKHSPITWFGESGPIRRATEPSLKKRMESRRAYSHLEWLPSIHEKTARARNVQALASMGKVKIPKSKPWLNHVLTHWLQFPAGRQDDAVDVLSLMGRGLEFVQSAGQPKKRNHVGMSNPSQWMA